MYRMDACMQDIVIPVLLSPTQGMQHTPLNRFSPYKYARKNTFFFAGRICGDRKPPVDGKCSFKREDYSASVRQRVGRRHAHPMHD